MAESATVYGKYTLGSGEVLSDPEWLWRDLDDPLVLDSYEQSIRKDLLKAGLSPDRLQSWAVMDVGTGRQALALLRLGAKWVSHYDLSPENVERVAHYIITHKKQDRLGTTCCDLVTADLGDKKFNFIYLNGVAQHFSDVGAGLSNLFEHLLPGGYFWLYFYRAGTFHQFLMYMLRDLIHGSNVALDQKSARDYFLNAMLTYSDRVSRNYLVSCFMDSLFTPYAHLYSLQTYLDFATACGFEVVSSSGIDPLGGQIDHFFSRPATVLTLKKAIASQVTVRVAEMLSPERAVNELDPKNYQHPDILKSIALYQKLKVLCVEAKVPASAVVSAVLRLYYFGTVTIAEPSYDSTKRHVDLQHILGNIIHLFTSELSS